MIDPWVLSYRGLDPHQEGLREALCTLGNGVFATRGAAEEQRAGEVSYPGTYVAGGYNQLESEVAGRTVVNEDLVNLPSWLWLTFRPADGEWLDLWNADVIDYEQQLDMREGILTRRFRVRDARGRVTRVESRRLVHMAKPHLAALEWRVIPEGWSGDAVFRAGIDGAVTNSGVARYRQLASRHLDVLQRAAVSPEGIYLKARTTQSDIEVAVAARTRVFEAQSRATVERRVHLDEPDRIAEDLHVELRDGEPLRLEKVVALFTSRDRGISEPGVDSRLAIQRAPDFSTLKAEHVAAWKRLWRRCDVEIDAVDDDDEPAMDQLILRLHIFHMLQTASPHTVGRDVGIPARGLHGEAYRGHVFWDELFILPFYIQRLPEVAKTTLLYRYHRLDAARAIAKEAGCRGAAFPWQSSSDGREATQQLHLNPLSGRWDPDNSHLQRHVGAAIAYNAWRYFEATGDRAFMEDYGAELLLEIATFFSSLARENPSTGRYEIKGVMGPDEYHERYPDAEVGGLSNNAYTNVMAVWCLLRGLDVLAAVSRERRAELLEMLSIDDDELARWRDMTRKMTVPFHDDVISAFDGYAELQDLDWEAYLSRYGRIERLDRILKAEGTTPDRFKVSKQPDVIMLLYVLSPDELTRIFEDLGYPLDDDAVRRNVEYYERRTSHGSTLSKVVFTSAVHRQDSEAGGRLFLLALHSDFYDVQGGTTPEGVHLGAMGGTVDIVTRHYAGLEMAAECVRFAPDVPERIRRLRFRSRYRERWLTVELTLARLTIDVDDAEPTPVPVEVYGERHEIEPGGRLAVAIEPAHKTRSRPRTSAEDERRVVVDEERLAGGAP